MFVVVPLTNWVAVTVTVVEEITDVVVEAAIVMVVLIWVLCWSSVVVEVLSGS